MTTAHGLDDYIDIGRPDTATRETAVRFPAFLARPYALVRAIPDVGTYLGVGLIVVGFVLLAICWGKVAGLTTVAYQMPYLASAGLTGLGLIVTGIAIVGAASREKDAALRRAQLAELAGTLRQLRLLLDEPAPVGPTPEGAAELTTELPAVNAEPAVPAAPRVRRRTPAARTSAARTSAVKLAGR